MRFARRIAAAITGAATYAKPVGSPRLRSVIRVRAVVAGSHVYVVSIGNGPSAVRITSRSPGTSSTHLVRVRQPPAQEPRHERHPRARRRPAAAVSHATESMFTYHSGAFDGSPAYAATSSHGRVDHVSVTTSTTTRPVWSAARSLTCLDSRPLFRYCLIKHILKQGVVMADALSLFERATAHACQVLAQVSPEQLALPTPCSEWDVQALIDHLAGGPAYLLGALSEGRHPGRTTPSATPRSATGGSRRWHVPVPGRSGACRRWGSSGRWREATAGTFMDQLVHTWDLAVATGQDPGLDPELVDACVAMFLPEMPERGRAAGIVGPAVAVPPGAVAPRTGCWPRWAAGRDRIRTVEAALRAIAIRGRRAMLRLVWDAERTASELAEAAGLSAPRRAST